MSEQMPRSTEHFVEKFSHFENSLNGEASSAVHQIRKSALACFKSGGLPTRKIEAWRFTDISELGKLNLKLATKTTSPAIEQVKPFLVNQENPRCVFVNGNFSPELSDIGTLEGKPGLKISSLREILTETGSQQEKEFVVSRLSRHAAEPENAVLALSTAFANDGLLVRIEKETKTETPLEVMFLTSGDEEQIAVYPRLFILAEEHSEFRIIEQHIGLSNNTYLSSPVTDIQVRKNAKLEHFRIQRESENAYHLSNLQLDLAEESQGSSCLSTFGSKLTRNEANLVLNGENIQAGLNGLTVIGAKQHVDNNTCIDHAKAHCESNQMFKGIYSDSSSGVFSGTIIVRPDSQKTNAIQSNSGLLLSEKAQLNSQPQLKIWADDVKCTHGATIGQIDENALFYLRSRGIEKSLAKSILIKAYASELVEQLEFPKLEEKLKEIFFEKLAELSI